MQQAIQQTGTTDPYEGFLEMPVFVVLTVMWLAGTALSGVGVLTLYLLVAWVSVA
jgi:hypothetical protein